MYSHLWQGFKGSVVEEVCFGKAIKVYSGQLIFTLSSPTETMCLSISLSTPLDLLGISLGIHTDWFHEKTISIHFQPVCSTELTGRQNSGVALFTVSSWNYSYVYVMLCDIENVFVLLKLQSTSSAVEVKQSTGMYLLREALTSVTKWKGPDCLEHGPWSMFAVATDIECFLLLLSIFLSPCLTLCFP